MELELSDFDVWMAVYFGLLFLIFLFFKGATNGNDD
jgi:hypothetical protein